MRTAGWQLLGAGLLGGMAAMPAQAQNALKDAPKLRGSHGFVRVSLLDTLDTLELEARGERYPLTAQAALGGTEYGAWLPPGDYRVVQLRRRDKSPFAPVHVEAGQLIDLGGLSQVAMDGLFNQPLHLEHPELDAQALKTAELLGLDPQKRSVWRTDELAQAWRGSSRDFGLIGKLIDDALKQSETRPLGERLRQATLPAEALALARKAASPQHEKPGLDKDGTLYFGARFGQIKLRTADGRWRSLDTGSLQTMTAVSIDGERLLAGGRQGLLRGSVDAGKTWSTLAQLPGDESIVDISARQERWWIVSAVLTPHVVDTQGQVTLTRRVKLYSAPLDQPERLSLVREFKRDADMDYWIGDASLAQWQGEHLLINLQDRVERLHVPTSTWSKLNLPHDANLFHISGDRMMTALNAVGFFSTLSVSSDAGATWRKMPKPPGAQFRSISFDSPNSGLTQRWNYSTGTEFYRYVADAKDWVQEKVDPATCLRMLHDAAGTARYCVSFEGAVLALVDGRWKLEELP